MHKGPPNGDVDSGLEQLRYAVLTDGIPSNSDGMVGSLVRLTRIGMSLTMGSV